MTEQLRELEGQTPLTDAVLAQIPSTMDTQLDADFMNIMVRHARDLERALTAAKAELAAKSEDAARYRWLRRMIFDERIIQCGGHNSATMLCGEKLDSAIDSARKVSHER